MARVLGKVRGAADVNVEKVSGLAYLQIEIDREKIARYGINVADIHDVIETAIGGKEASKIYDGLKVLGSPCGSRRLRVMTWSRFGKSSFRPRTALSFHLANLRRFM